MYSPWLLYSNGLLVVAIISPLQLSVAFGISETVTEHSPIKSESVAIWAIGFSKSLIVIFWITLILFPALSVTE